MEQTLKENWLKKKQIKWAIENPKQYQEWKNKNEEKVYEKKKEQSKIYREKNKEELKEKRSEILKCECGADITRNSINSR